MRILRILSILSIGAAVQAQSFNQSSITLIPNTNSSGAPVSAGTLLFRDLQIPTHATTLESMDSVPQIAIVTATAANPMVLTLASTPPVWVKPGATVVISGAAGAGCTTMNGSKAVSAASGTSVTITYNGTGCTYTASSASILTHWVYKMWGPDAAGGGAVCSDGAQNLSINPACGTAGSGVPGAPTNSIQTNCSPNFCGSANFTRDPATGNVHSLGTAPADYATDVGAGPYGSVLTGFQVGLKNTGSATANVGPSVTYFGDNSGGTKSNMGRVGAVWDVPTAGLEVAHLSFFIRGNSADVDATTEIARVTTNGVGPSFDNLYDLGDSSHYWAHAYAKVVQAQIVDIGNGITTGEFAISTTACAGNCFALRILGFTNPLMTFFQPASRVDFWANAIPQANDTWTLGCATCGTGSTLREWNDLYVKNLHCTGTGCPSSGVTDCAVAYANCMTLNTNQTVTGVKTWSASQLMGADNTYDIGTTTVAPRNVFSRIASTEDVLIGAPGTNFATHWDFKVGSSSFDLIDPTSSYNQIGITKYGAHDTQISLYGTLTPGDTSGSDGNLGDPSRAVWVNLFLSGSATIGGLGGGGVRSVCASNIGLLQVTGCPGGGAGTVTSVATSGPITGGTFTTSGTIGCPSCITTAGGQTIGGSLTINGGGLFTNSLTPTVNSIWAIGGVGIQYASAYVNNYFAYQNIFMNGTQVMDSSRNMPNIATITSTASVSGIYDVTGGYFGQDRTGGIPVLTATGTCTIFFKGGILYAFSGGGC